MNLASTITILSGGQGSGCKGPNCGRKDSGMKETKEQYEYRMKKYQQAMKRMASKPSGKYYRGAGEGEIKNFFKGREIGISWTTSHYYAKSYAEISEKNGTNKKGYVLMGEPKGWGRNFEINDRMDPKHVNQIYDSKKNLLWDRSKGFIDKDFKGKFKK